MRDRKELIKALELCIKLKDKACPRRCPFYKECCLSDETHPFIPIMRAALELLKKEEQIPDTTTWVQHLYRFGSKRFECSWCHGTSWRPSDYCPDCGTRMAETVVNKDD